VYTIERAVVQVNRPLLPIPRETVSFANVIFPTKACRRQNVLLCPGSRSAAQLRSSVVSNTYVLVFTNVSHISNEQCCPQRRDVVLRHIAGGAADFQSVTRSTVPGRGVQECLMSQIDVSDSLLSGLVGCAPLLSRYDFHGLAHVQAIHRDGNLYIDL